MRNGRLNLDLWEPRFDKYMGLLRRLGMGPGGSRFTRTVVTTAAAIIAIHIPYALVGVRRRRAAKWHMRPKFAQVASSLRADGAG